MTAPPELMPACATGLPTAPADTLAQDHEALLTFLYAAPVGLAQTDLDGQIELINSVTAMLLMPLARRQGGGMDNLFDLLGPLAPDLRQRVAALGDSLGPVCDDLRLPLAQPGKPLRWAALRLVRLDARRLVATISDITAQVQAEQGRQLAEERLRFAMNAALVGDWVLDCTSHRLQGSPMASRCFGGEALAADVPLASLLARVHPDDRDAVRDSLHEAMQAPRPWRSEFRVGAAGDSPRWLTMHAHPVLRPGAAPLLAGVVFDTTHERQADDMRRHAAALADENRRLHETSRLKSRFVATMSHELRSPLTSILGFTDLLRGGVARPGTPEFDDCLARIADNGQHLLRLVNDVLDLSKVEAGKLDFRPAPLALAPLLAEVRAAMAPQWQGKHQTVDLEAPAGLGEVHHDAARLRQVLGNLMSNAVKFTPVGGRVLLRAEALAGQRFALEVIDTGIGIAASDLPRLFTEFQQIDNGNGRSHEGTGLGLALSRRLVQALGGDITVSSTPGQGSCFRVELPRSHGDRPDHSDYPDHGAAANRSA